MKKSQKLDFDRDLSMLINFTVANFRSIAEAQTLSMVASKDATHGSTHVANLTGKTRHSILRSAVIYGANASGKSNILNALRVFKDIVINSAKFDVDDKVPVVSHAFGVDWSNRSTDFDINFIYDDIRYNYGFSANKNEILEEWLFAYPEGRASRWLYRKGSDKNSWYINPSIKGPKKTWIDSTKDNSLLLSTALQLNAEALNPIQKWFKSKLGVFGQSFTHEYSAERSCDAEFKSKVLKFLNNADFGIGDVVVNKKKVSMNDIPDDAPSFIKEFLNKELSGQDLIHLEVKTKHENSLGDIAEFDLDDESLGTQKVFNLSGPWLNTLEKGNILFMDEMDTSLHPLIVKYLVSQFNNPDVNINNAQLIFTTHDTSLLNQKMYRRDQIWLCEKGKDKKTSIYSLLDFGLRKDENIEKGYLGGRYGAIPFVYD